MSKRAPAAKAFPSFEEIKANRIPQKVGEDPSSVVVGLDLSSTCVGWALDLNGKPVTWGKMVFKSTATMGEKLIAFEDLLNTLLSTYQPGVLVVEKPMARRGATTARHNQLLGILLKVWYQFKKEELKESWIISARTIKLVVGVKYGGDHDKNKENMVRKINSLLGLKLKYDPNSAYASDDDTADALAVIITYRRRNASKRGKKDV